MRVVFSLFWNYDRYQGMLANLRYLRMYVLIRKLTTLKTEPMDTFSDPCVE